MSYKAQLDAFLKERGVGRRSTFSLPSLPSAPSFEGVGEIPWGKIGLYITVATLIVLLILVIIHYTIRPIFRFKSGSKGFITIPGISGADDGALYWPSIRHGYLNESDTIFQGSTSTITNCSLAIDLFFIDLNVGVNAENKLRPIMLRYNPNMGDLTNPKYMIGMFLDPVLNDLYVRVRTTANNKEQVILKNVPSNKPIRVGIIIQPTYFEVYRNGLLVKTKLISDPPIGDVGRFWCNPGGDATADSKSCGGSEGLLGHGINLHLWPRALAAQEMQYSMPAMPTADTFLKPNTRQGIAGYLSDVGDDITRQLDTIKADGFDILASTGTAVSSAINNITNTSVASLRQNVSNIGSTLQTTVQNSLTSTIR